MKPKRIFILPIVYRRVLSSVCVCVCQPVVDAYLKCFNVIVDSVRGRDDGGGNDGGGGLPVNTTITWQIFSSIS